MNDQTNSRVKSFESRLANRISLAPHVYVYTNAWIVPNGDRDPHRYSLSVRICIYTYCHRTDIHIGCSVGSDGI